MYLQVNPSLALKSPLPVQAAWWRGTVCFFVFMVKHQASEKARANSSTLVCFHLGWFTIGNTGWTCWMCVKSLTSVLSFFFHVLLPLSLRSKGTLLVSVFCSPDRHIRAQCPPLLAPVLGVARLKGAHVHVDLYAHSSAVTIKACLIQSIKSLSFSLCNPPLLPPPPPNFFIYVCDVGLCQQQCPGQTAEAPMAMKC